MEQSKAGAGGVGSTPGFRAVTSLAGSSLTPTCCQCWVPASPPQHLTPLSSATGCPMDPSTTYYTRGQVSADGGDRAGAEASPTVLGELLLRTFGAAAGTLPGHGRSSVCSPHAFHTLSPSTGIATPCPHVQHPFLSDPDATSFPADFVVDQMQAVKFAFDIARGMAFLHTLEPLIPRHHLNSRSIMVSASAERPCRCGCVGCYNPRSLLRSTRT